MAAFDIQTDVKIYIEQYPSNQFILGLSLLGGPDLLGTNSPTWVELECDVTELEWSRGSSANLGILTIPEPASARLNLQTLDQDPIANKQMRVGARIRIDVIDSTAATVRVFTGRIDSMFVTYDVDGQMLLEIFALDAAKQAVNSGYFPGATAPVGTISQVLEYALGLQGITPHASSQSSTIPTSYFNDSAFKTTGDLINWLTDAEQGWFMLTPDGDEFIFYNRQHTTTALAGGATYTASNIHSTDPSHLCLTDVQVVFDNFDQANLVNGTLADGMTTGYRANHDSIELYGVTQADVEVTALLSQSQLDSWLDAITTKMTNKVIKQISVNGLTTSGETSGALTLQQGQAIETEFTRNGSTITETSIISKVTHSLRINSWDAKIEIWKGN